MSNIDINENNVGENSIKSIAENGDNTIGNLNSVIENSKKIEDANKQVTQSLDKLGLENNQGLTKNINQCSENCGEVGQWLSIFSQIFELITAPVAGPCYIWLFYIFLVIFSVTFFIVNLVFLINDWAGSTVTEVNLKWEKTLNYPDIYICMPAAVFYHSFKCCGFDCTENDSGGATDSTADCGNWAFLGLALENSQEGCMGFGKFDDFSRHYSATSCPYSTYIGNNTPIQYNYYQRCPEIGGVDSNGDSCTWPYIDSNMQMTQFPTHEWATGLENKLPIYNITSSNTFGGTTMAGNSYKSTCYYFKSDKSSNAQASYEKITYLQNAFATSLTDAVSRELPHLKMYLMEAGKKPYDGEGILANEVVWPTLGMKTIGTITVNKYKDESKGDTEWKYLYNMGLSSQPVNAIATLIAPAATSSVDLSTQGADYSEITGWKHRFNDPLSMISGTTHTLYLSGNTNNNLIYAFNALTISDFVVNEITVRNRTPSEYWAAIGGLFAGSLLILNLFFISSGVTFGNRQVKLFNFVCQDKKDKWLSKYEETDKLQELEKRISNLEPNIML